LWFIKNVIKFLNNRLFMIIGVIVLINMFFNSFCLHSQRSAILWSLLLTNLNISQIRSSVSSRMLTNMGRYLTSIVHYSPQQSNKLLNLFAPTCIQTFSIRCHSEKQGGQHDFQDNLINFIFKKTQQPSFPEF
jgi:hypothetical protein